MMALTLQAALSGPFASAPPQRFALSQRQTAAQLVAGVCAVNARICIRSMAVGVREVMA